MKIKTNIKTIIIIAVALTAVTLRLISNKNSFEHGTSSILNYGKPERSLFASYRQVSRAEE